MYITLARFVLTQHFKIYIGLSSLHNINFLLVQIQQAGTSTPTSSQSTLAAASPVQFLQVTNASGQSGSQAAGVTSVLRAVSVVSRAQTPTQISLVSSTPIQPSASASQPAVSAQVSASVWSVCVLVCLVYFLHAIRLN